MIHSSIAIQVLPVQERAYSTAEIVRIVDAVIAYIAATGLRYEVGPFETTVEGPFGQLIEIIRRANEICIEEGADQVYCYVKISHAPGKAILTIDEKVTKHKHEA